MLGIGVPLVVWNPDNIYLSGQSGHKPSYIIPYPAARTRIGKEVPPFPLPPGGEGLESHCSFCLLSFFPFVVLAHDSLVPLQTARVDLFENKLCSATHNSANATRCQTQFARLLSQAHKLKINRDHCARLVSSNRETFCILTVRRYDTFSLRGGH